uniref:Uncharacterized protein n=1 Tax=Leersia perrieri TaxID=77586 RepID=A0A0D9WEF1_9ORYZ
MDTVGPSLAHGVITKKINDWFAWSTSSTHTMPPNQADQRLDQDWFAWSPTHLQLRDFDYTSLATISLPQQILCTRLYDYINNKIVVDDYIANARRCRFVHKDGHHRVPDSTSARRFIDDSNDRPVLYDGNDRDSDNGIDRVIYKDVL